MVQHLAELANCQLRVINLSQQTDMVDLVGGFKPVPLRRSVAKIIDELHELLSIRHVSLFTPFRSSKNCSDWAALSDALSFGSR